MIRGEIRVTSDNRRKAARVLGHASFTRFLRSIADEGVEWAQQWARYYIYDTPESPSYKRTWRLFHSIGSTVYGDGRIVIDAGVRYARYVHDGTRHMSPRPFLSMALDDLKDHVYEYARIHYRGIR